MIARQAMLAARLPDGGCYAAVEYCFPFEVEAERVHESASTWTYSAAGGRCLDALGNRACQVANSAELVLFCEPKMEGRKNGCFRWSSLDADLGRRAWSAGNRVRCEGRADKPRFASSYDPKFYGWMAEALPLRRSHGF
jgi:hypothetical protein